MVGLQAEARELSTFTAQLHPPLVCPQEWKWILLTDRPSQLSGPPWGKMISICKPRASFEKTSITREGYKKVYFPTVDSVFMSLKPRKTWGVTALLLGGMKVCEGSMGIHHFCLWILKRCTIQWIGGSELGNGFEMDPRAVESHFPHAWVPGGRLWTWWPPWRSQGNGLQLLWHSSDFHYLGFYRMSVCTHVHILHVGGKSQKLVVGGGGWVRVSGSPGFRSLTSWVTCATISIFRFPLSRVGMMKSIQFRYWEDYMIWKALDTIHSK